MKSVDPRTDMQTDDSRRWIGGEATVGSRQEAPKAGASQKRGIAAIISGVGLQLGLLFQLHVSRSLAGSGNGVR